MNDPFGLVGQLCLLLRTDICLTTSKVIKVCTSQRPTTADGDRSLSRSLQPPLLPIGVSLVSFTNPLSSEAGNLSSARDAYAAKNLILVLPIKWRNNLFQRDIGIQFYKTWIGTH